MSSVIELVALDITDQELLSSLCAEVPTTYPFQCRIGAAEKLPVSALDMHRGQYQATRILEHLASSDRDAVRLLGITTADLFTPILRYIFGEAMLPGKAAIVSTHRLGNLSRGTQPPCDRPLFISRVIKEGIHELGHTFGLTHCADPSCVMTASREMARIDAKSTQLCRYCRILLDDFLTA
ncbi:archaemetzincin family Zn-dependent metalloprotease [Candidatus Fermentibacteria bacterium]|nr:archaemetzincin family Zn-dependent metalloprotease [Candidatus Fermentibacteria bacterium]